MPINQVKLPEKRARVYTLVSHDSSWCILLNNLLHILISTATFASSNCSTMKMVQRGPRYDAMLKSKQSGLAMLGGANLNHPKKKQT
jgi:hypothetical protein